MAQATLGDMFGRSLAISADGNLLAIGTPNRLVAPHQYYYYEGRGVVYVFQRSGATWTQHSMLTAANPAATRSFASSVALSSDGGTLVVGGVDERAENDTSTFTQGVAYVFTRSGSGSGWTRQASLKAHNPDPNDGFASRVSISGDGRTIAVGAGWEDGGARWFGSTTGDDDSLLNAGAVYMFQLGSSGWVEMGFLKPGNENRNFALFGAALALSRDGSTLAVGAPWESSAAHIGGAAYLF